MLILYVCYNFCFSSQLVTISLCILITFMMCHVTLANLFCETFALCLSVVHSAYCKEFTLFLNMAPLLWSKLVRYHYREKTANKIEVHRHLFSGIWWDISFCLSLFLQYTYTQTQSPYTHTHSWYTHVPHGYSPQLQKYLLEILSSFPHVLLFLHFLPLHCHMVWGQDLSQPTIMPSKCCSFANVSVCFFQQPAPPPIFLPRKHVWSNIQELPASSLVTCI